ncbi:hypothetical protein HSBAA_30710 [Vreelandella sulfidaeris]|uniref:Calcineurin-like phosphoesterase domain-containing protein n=1 Tax=Vreelandella sulfidaeris TaxID=115553 RepID=A0A455U730_9GAMM|nr:hypothetical protein HSBAA_30710 [Halomonas sulfidaeris]
MKFGIISDTHYHPFTAFAKQDGLINSRLQIAMDETRKAAVHMKDAGCTALYHCGDIFHVRGRVAPSVLNPVADLFKEIAEELGMPIFALAGNHDLEFENSNRIGNSGTALTGDGITVVSDEPFFQPVHNVLMIPWHAKQKDLLATIEAWLKEAPARFGVKAEEVTLMIHAPSTRSSLAYRITVSIQTCWLALASRTSSLVTTTTSSAFVLACSL